MPTRVLLISINRCAAPDPVFPLGLAQLNGGLRTAGHEVRWLDVLASTEPLSTVLAEFKPNLVGISIRNIDDVLIRKQQTYFDDLPALCAAIHQEAQCPVVLGGSGFSIFPQALMELAGADYGIAGAGESALIELVSALENKRTPAHIPGLVWRQGNAFRTNAPAPLHNAPPLAESDLPAPIASYYLRTGGMLNVQTQRGCAFHCVYCTYPLIEGRAHCRRAPDDVAEEFEVAARMGAKYVFIVDSVFNSSPRHVHEVCEAILRRNLKIAWGCFLRPQGLTAELIELMRRAGLAHAEFGSDSFSDTVLNAYRKGFTFEDVLLSSELAQKAGMDFCHFLICGGPGETRDTLAESFANSQRLQGAVIMAVVGMRIYPGTQVFERAVAEGLIRPDANLLSPTYYISPELSVGDTFSALQEFARVAPNWIIGDPSPAYTRLVEQLRRRGIVGPLWSYLAMIQRLWPAEPAPLAGSNATAAATFASNGRPSQ